MDYEIAPEEQPAETADIQVVTWPLILTAALGLASLLIGLAAGPTSAWSFGAIIAGAALLVVALGVSAYRFFASRAARAARAIGYISKRIGK